MTNDPDVLDSGPVVPTHFYCECCDKVTPAILESLDGPDRTGKFLGGDVVCADCRFVIATMYREKPCQNPVT